MASDYYLKIEGIKGETTAAGMTDFMEIDSFSFGASNPTTIGSQTKGSGGGKVSLSTFSVMKRTDTASPVLFQKCASGQHFKSAKVQIKKSAGDDAKQSTYVEYNFKQVYVDAIQWSGSGSPGASIPMESLSFSFEAVEIKYWGQKEDGTMETASIDAMWSVKKNEAAF